MRLMADIANAPKPGTSRAHTPLKYLFRLSCTASSTPGSYPVPILPMLPPPLPYAAASPTQRQQALLSARHVLDVAFPHLSRAHWVAALDEMQPLLLTLPDQPVHLTHEGLAALALHLTTVTVPDGREQPSSGAVPLGQPPKMAAAKKQTYTIPLDLCEQLANLSYWRRIGLSQLVRDALAQLLDQYPEARRPRPDRDPLPPPT